MGGWLFVAVDWCFYPLWWMICTWVVF